MIAQEARGFGTIMADPPWRFDNRTGKCSPEHRRLHRYETMDLEDVCAMGPQVLELAADQAHLYLWIPTALLAHGMQVMAAWGFAYKTSVFWHKVTAAGASDRACMGAYFRNVVEPCLFGVNGAMRTRGRSEPSLFPAVRTGHSRKPQAIYEVIERQSPGPYLELFARAERPGWTSWGNGVADRGVVLITTNPLIRKTWREVVGAIFGTSGQAELPLADIYAKAEDDPRVERAKALGHKWRSQIRRTLQEHFRPAGWARWAA